MTNAKQEIENLLTETETVEAVVFGPWGWGDAPDEGEDWEEGHGEPEPTPVPFNKRGVALTFEEAAPMMESWSFYGGFGSPKCYAVRIWTSDRVFWVTQYDGSTSLDWTDRNPSDTMPDMPGG